MEIYGEDSIQSRFVRLVRLYHRSSFEIFKETEIHPKQIPLLVILDETEGVSQKEISVKLETSAPTVAVSIKRLEKAGLVERRTDERDQRMSRIYLTAKGKEVIKSTKARLKETEKQIFQGFSESEICLMKRFFDQMIKNLSEA